MKQKVKQSTEKPYIDEMRLINGKPMIWDGKNWITENDWDIRNPNSYETTLNNAYNEVWNGKQG